MTENRKNYGQTSGGSRASLVGIPTQILHLKSEAQLGPWLAQRLAGVFPQMAASEIFLVAEEGTGLQPQLDPQRGPRLLRALVEGIESMPLALRDSSSSEHWLPYLMVPHLTWAKGSAVRSTRGLVSRSPLTANALPWGSLISAPLFSGATVLGVVVAAAPPGEDFGSDDLDLLTGIAAQVALGVRGLRAQQRAWQPQNASTRAEPARPLKTPDDPPPRPVPQRSPTPSGARPTPLRPAPPPRAPLTFSGDTWAGRLQAAPRPQNQHRPRAPQRLERQGASVPPTRGPASFQDGWMRYDLALARELQRTFLPSLSTGYTGLKVEAEYRPAHEVGGDFYDLVDLHDGRVTVLIGDVSGKGVAAALLMARLSSELRQFASGNIRPRAILENVNRWLESHHPSDRFATGACVQLDLRKGTGLVANAGHLPPLIKRAGGPVVRVAEMSGPPLGLIPDQEYPEESFTMSRGDILVLVTDGVVEALNENPDSSGVWSLVNLVASLPPQLSAVRKGLIARVEKVPPRKRDDATLLCLELTEAGEKRPGAA